MNDLERELRLALDREAGEAPAPHDARGAVLRTRQRQVGMIAGSVIAAVALIAIAVVGIGSLTDEPDEVIPASTTQTMNGITITFPDGWALIDPDEAGLNSADPSPDLPRLVLAIAPFDPGELFACPGMAERPHTFLMTIQEQPLALSGSSAIPWPVEPVLLQIIDEDSCYPGWELWNAEWTAERRTFQARLGFAPDVTETDRDALLAAFSSMSFEPVSGGPTSVVLATGSAGGEEWELTATNDGDELVLGLQGESFGSGIGGFDPSSDELRLSSYVFGSGAEAQRIIFGATPADAVQVGVRVVEDDELLIDVLDVPDAIDSRLNAFVVSLLPEHDAIVYAYDAAGRVIASGRISGDEGEPVETPLPDDVLPNDVQPQQGGTYWAAYVWLGPAGDEGADVTARQVRQLGATPSVGELACDQGAAEALATDAKWRVAVYFETRQDAEDWYLGSGLAGHEAEGGVAQVTTFCLD